MSGAVGSNFKKIIIGPSKVFQDIQRAGDVAEVSLCLLLRGVITLAVFLLFQHKTNCAGESGVGKSESACLSQFSFSPSMGKAG